MQDSDLSVIGYTSASQFLISLMEKLENNYCIPAICLHFILEKNLQN